jgi:hypothetical protein
VYRVGYRISVPKGVGCMRPWIHMYVIVMISIVVVIVVVVILLGMPVYMCVCMLTFFGGFL